MKKLMILLIAAGIGGSALSLTADWEHDSRPHEADDYRKLDDTDSDSDRFFQRLLGLSEKDSPNRSWLFDPRAELYRSECGGCHLAYPPTMLPTVSWQATMATLEDHFGENAELDLETGAQILNFLGDHAAGQGRGDYSERMWRATRGMAPSSRITETDYFIGQHHEIPPTMVAGNPEVRSFSRCEACHTRAAEGSFDEHDVRMAGYGRWDD